VGGGVDGWRRQAKGCNRNEKVVVNVEAKTRGGRAATEDAKGKPGTATCLA